MIIPITSEMKRKAARLARRATRSYDVTLMQFLEIRELFIFRLAEKAAMN